MGHTHTHGMPDITASYSSVATSQELDVELAGPEDVDYEYSWQPAEWEASMREAWWYWISPFAYTVPGALTALRSCPLFRYAPLFPFRIMGCGVFLNAFLSYGADVAMRRDISVLN